MQTEPAAEQWAPVPDRCMGPLHSGLVTALHESECCRRHLFVCGAHRAALFLRRLSAHSKLCVGMAVQQEDHLMSCHTTRSHSLSAKPHHCSWPAGVFVRANAVNTNKRVYPKASSLWACGSAASSLRPADDPSGPARRACLAPPCLINAQANHLQEVAQMVTGPCCTMAASALTRMSVKVGSACPQVITASHPGAVFCSLLTAGNHRGGGCQVLPQAGGGGHRLWGAVPPGVHLRDVQGAALGSRQPPGKQMQVGMWLRVDDILHP